MTAITDRSLPISIDGLLKYVLNDFNDDPVFNELIPNSISDTELQKTPSKNLKRKTTKYLNQPIAKKAHIKSNSSSRESSVITSPKSKRKLINSINRIHEKTNAYSLEKIQIHYANQLNVDLQEIKKIYLSISTDCPTASEPSVIKIKTALPITNSIIVSPESKKKLVNIINRFFHTTNRSLEELQISCAHKLNIALQEVKKIYLAVSTHCPTASKPSVINVKTTLPVKSNVIISSESKKKLVKTINQFFDKVKTSSLEKIQTFYADRLKLDLQEIKNICFALPHKLKDLNLRLKVSSTDTILIIPPAAKKNLANNITYLYFTTDKPLEEILISYANQFMIALQDIKKIYLAITTNCLSANTVSKIKKVNALI